MGFVGAWVNDKPGLSKRWSDRHGFVNRQTGRQGFSDRRSVRQARARQQQVSRVTDGELKEREEGYQRTGRTSRSLYNAGWTDITGK